MLVELLQRSILRRAVMLQDPATANGAVRLIDGSGDDLPDFCIDKVGPVALVHYFPVTTGFDYGDRPVGTDPQLLGLIEAVKEVLPTVAGIKSAYLWEHQRQGVQTAQGGAKLLFGDAVDSIDLEADGVRFAFQPVATSSGGLFLDTRQIRRALAAGECRGKRMLNLFCFTGTLGIAAAVGGASEVVQVDVSKSVLKWAKRNWELQSVPGCNMRFLPDDAREFLAREQRRVERGLAPFGCIVLDPPSFSSSSGNTFKVEKEYQQLLADCLRVLSRGGGVLYAIANYRSWATSNIADMAQMALREAGVSGASITPLVVPGGDFTATEDLSTAGRGVRVVV